MSTRQLPDHPDLGQYRKQAKELLFLKAVEAATGCLSSRQVWTAAERAVVDGDVPNLERLLRDYPRVFRHERPQSRWNNTLRPHYEAGTAQDIVRSTHEFDTWADCAAS